MEITYSKHGDYYLPDLVLSEEEPATYGRFGRMRLKYLKEHRRATYINLKTSGDLTNAIKLLLNPRLTKTGCLFRRKNKICGNCKSISAGSDVVALEKCA